MKKLLAILPLVAGASWAGTTYYSGAQTRDAYDQLLAQLSQITAFTVENESYTSGFMKSSAVTLVKTSDKDDAEIMFRLSHDIDHTPIGFNEGATRVSASNILTTFLIDPNSDASEKLGEIFGDAEPAVLQSTVGFNGKTLNVLRTAPIEIIGDDGTLQISEGLHKFDLDPDGKLTGSGEMGALTFASAEGFNFSTSSIKQVYDLNWVQTGVFTGSNTMTLDKASIVGDNSMTVDLNGVTFEQLSEASNGTVGYDLILSVADVQSPVDLKTLKFSNSLSGLNMDAFAKAQAWSNEILLQDPESMDPTVILGDIGTLYKNMISKGASISYGMGFTNTGGKADSTFTLTFKGDDSANGMDNLATVGDLIHALQASLTVDADAAALESTPLAMMLYSPQASQVLVEENGKYTANITLDDAVLDINGQPLSLALMLQEPMQMPLDPSLLMMMPGTR